jgi:CIC family chloride channel protein
MIFEMTLDYGIVVPMIIAVAISIGIRRVLSRENIYTIKLQARRHFIPKALHANMFLVRHAKEVMDSDVLVLPAAESFDAFLRAHEAENRLHHVVVVSGDQIFGVIRVNTGLRRGLESTTTGVTLGEVATRDFTVVGEDTVISDVIDRMWRKQAFMAVVVAGRGVPRAADVVGIISREHVANSVADGLKIYPG